MRRLLKQAAFKTITSLFGGDDDLVRLPVLAGPARGLRFHVDLVNRAESAFLLNRYEKRALATAASRVGKYDTVWDCGVYFGLYTLMFARSAARVLAFEPDPANIARTRRNATANGLHNIEIVHAAIAGESGKGPLQISLDSNSHIPGMYIGGTRGEYVDRSSAVIDVEYIALDDALARYGRPDFVKIDIEGAEVSAVRNATALLSDARPQILLELHNPEADAMAWEVMSRFDYAMRQVEIGVEITSRDTVGGTILCIPREHL